MTENPRLSPELEASAIELAGAVSDLALRTALGPRLAREGEHVEDMGHRVATVLDGNPRDNFYAGEKLSSALRGAAYALAIIGWPEESIAAIVRDAHERGARYREDVTRELREGRR